MHVSMDKDKDKHKPLKGRLPKNGIALSSFYPQVLTKESSKSFELFQSSLIDASRNFAIITDQPL